MNQRFHALFVVATTILAVSPPTNGAPRPKGPRDEGIEGTWRQTHVEFEGRNQNANERPYRNHWIITRDSITIIMKGEHRGAWSYKLVPGRGPTAIDLTTKSGGKDITYPCIYKLEGDKLTFCLQNFPEKGRPTKFESTAGSGIGMFIYERAKPGDEKAPGVDGKSDLRLG